MPNLTHLSGLTLLGRDIGVHRYVKVPRQASAIEIVAVLGGVVTGVLW